MERNEHVMRFLHTDAWQLGMTRHFFSEGVQVGLGGYQQVNNSSNRQELQMKHGILGKG